MNNASSLLRDLSTPPRGTTLWIKLIYLLRHRGIGYLRPLDIFLCELWWHIKSLLLLDSPSNPAPDKQSKRELRHDGGASSWLAEASGVIKAMLCSSSSW